MDDSQHERALSIARAKLEAGDLDGAKRFAKKALSMNDTPHAHKLMQEIEKVQSRCLRLNEGA